MILETYLDAVESLPFGRKYPNSVTIYRYHGAKLSREFRSFVYWVGIHSGAGSKSYNVVEFHLDIPRITFYSYPTLFTSPFPVLRSTIRTAPMLDAVMERRITTDHRTEENPPLLCKKEELFHPDDERMVSARVLTLEAEALGLYHNGTRPVQTRDDLTRALTILGVKINNYHLVPI